MGLFSSAGLMGAVGDILGGGGGSAPAAPDYIGAAREQGKQQLDLARQQTTANRVNQETPWGNLNYSVTGKDAYGNDIWTARQTLSPQQQQLFDQSNQLQNKGLDYVQNLLNKPFDTSLLPKQQIDAGQTAQDAIMARLEPAFSKRQQALETQLANQGIARGTEAWNNAISEMSNARNDAYTQAALQGMNIGQQARQQAMQEQSFLRNDPINLINSARSGMQLQNPNFVNAPQQSMVQAPDMMGAQQAAYQAQLNNYNASQAQRGNMMGGLMGLGGAAIGGMVGGPAGAATGYQIGSGFGRAM